MAIRLETTEDFEIAKKAFDNPNSVADQYCIQDFGFCSFCDSITQYLSSNTESGTVLCLDCNKVYRTGSYLEYYRDNPSYPYIINLPKESDTGERIHYLYSRHRQKDFFKESLNEFIKKNKAIERQAKNRVRRLAKLR